MANRIRSSPSRALGASFFYQTKLKIEAIAGNLMIHYAVQFAGKGVFQPLSVQVTVYDCWEDFVEKMLFTLLR